jgi:hypothetical protein
MLILCTRRSVNLRYTLEWRRGLEAGEGERREIVRVRIGFLLVGEE